MVSCSRAARGRCDAWASRQDADPTRTSGAATLTERYLQLQRQAGNQAVLSLLRWEARAAGVAQGGTVQRRRWQPSGESAGHDPAPGRHAEQEQWTAAYRAAVAKPSVEAYEPLFRDIAVTAGMAGLAAGFVPSTVPVSDGKTAKPGLNMTLNTSDEPGHTGWVDKNGVFGLPLKLGQAHAHRRVDRHLSCRRRHWVRTRRCRYALRGMKWCTPATR